MSGPSPSNQVNQPQPKPSQFQLQREVAMTRRLRSGSTIEEACQEMSRQPVVDHSVLDRLEGYSKIVGCSAQSFFDRYNSCFLHYSLDCIFAVAQDYRKAFTLICGLPSDVVSPGTTFGFTYLRAGVISWENVRISPVPMKRSTVLVIDSRLAKKSTTGSHFSRITSFLDDLVELQNHDPLHSVNINASSFSLFDRHLRYGGEEFAPLVVHSRYVRTVLLTDEKRAALHESIINFISDVADYSSLKERAYWVSVALRQLLLVIPTNDELVDGLLRHSEDSLFKEESITVSKRSWKRFLARDFSDGDEDDLGPRILNTTSYDHGKNSILRRWINDFFDIYMSGSSEDVSLTWSKFILLDVLGRGHGIYGVATAVDGEEEIFEACAAAFR